jgi:hypothetical protein
MSETGLLRCDGCGQMAGAEHIARRLARLERTTRFRPVHVQVLMLGGVAPGPDEEFLYAESGVFAGEAAAVLEKFGIEWVGKEREAVLSEVQKRGVLLVHVAECAAENGARGEELIGKQIGGAMARVRRSLKSKKLTMISNDLDGFLEQIQGAGCEVVREELRRGSSKAV